MYFARWWVNRFIAYFVLVQLWIRCICVGFEVNRSSLGRVFVQIFRFPAVSVIPPVLHAHSFFSHRRCVISAIDRVLKNAVKDTSMSSSWKLHWCMWLNLNTDYGGFQRTFALCYQFVFVCGLLCNFGVIHIAGLSENVQTERLQFRMNVPSHIDVELFYGFKNMLVITFVCLCVNCLHIVVWNSKGTMGV